MTKTNDDYAKPEKPLILRLKETGEYYDWEDEIFEDYENGLEQDN